MKRLKKEEWRKVKSFRYKKPEEGEWRKVTLLGIKRMKK
jgi:hypothetical protein